MRIRKRLLALVLAAAALAAFCEANYEPPILMYHRVSSEADPDHEPAVTPQTFARQMEFLRAHRYNVIGLADLADLIRQKKRVPRNTVVITFDDGYLDNFENAFPSLKALGLPAVIFMITDNIGRPGWLAAEDLKILDEAGIAIGSHTVSHAFLPNVYRKDELVRQVRESGETLRKILGHETLLFSYPAGGVTRESKDIVAEEGYAAAVTTNYGSERGDVYALRRIKVSDGDANLFKFWGKLTGLYRFGKSFVPIR